MAPVRRARPIAPAVRRRRQAAPAPAVSAKPQFDVPANIPIVAQLPGDVSMLKPGAKVSVGAANGTATRISISQ